MPRFGRSKVSLAGTSSVAFKHDSLPSGYSPSNQETHQMTSTRAPQPHRRQAPSSGIIILTMRKCRLGPLQRPPFVRDVVGMRLSISHFPPALHLTSPTAFSSFSAQFSAPRHQLCPCTCLRGSVDPDCNAPVCEGKSRPAGSPGC